MTEERVTRPELTKKEIYDRISRSWDFEGMIEPYRDGGTQGNKVVRTWGIVIDWLHVKKRYPVEIIGQAILIVMQRIKQHGHFNGDGTYGSAGNEFVEALRSTCDALMRAQMKKDVLGAIGQMRSQDMSRFIAQTVFSSLPWWVKLGTKNYWKFRKVLKKAKK